MRFVHTPTSEPKGDIDLDQLREEIKASLIAELLPHIQTGQEKVLSMVDGMKEGLPEMIRNSASEAATGALEEFEKRIKAEMGGGDPSEESNGRRGITLRDAKDLIPVLADAWSKLQKPSMVQDLGQILSWHTVLSRYERSGGQVEEVTKAIKDLGGR